MDLTMMLFKLMGLFVSFSSTVYAQTNLTRPVEVYSSSPAILNSENNRLMLVELSSLQKFNGRTQKAKAQAIPNFRLHQFDLNAETNDQGSLVEILPEDASRFHMYSLHKAGMFYYPRLALHPEDPTAYVSLVAQTQNAVKNQHSPQDSRIVLFKMDTSTGEVIRGPNGLHPDRAYTMYERNP